MSSAVILTWMAGCVKYSLKEWFGNPYMWCHSVLFFLAGNTRVVGQKELETFREEMRTRVSDAYTVILKDKKLPLALLNDNQKVRCCCCCALTSL